MHDEFYFSKQKTVYWMLISDCSSDVCSSDLTALVHEAYLKLIGRREAKFDDRAHFFAYAASAMRSVVVDYARQRLAQKRGGDLHRVTDLPEDIEGGLRLDEDMLGLDTALTKLAAVDERLARVVELRYFRSEEHQSELQSLMRLSYAVIGLKTQNK